MSQISTAVLNDSSATGRTFSRMGKVGRYIRYTHPHTSGKPGLDTTLDIEFRRNGNGAYAPSAKLEVPVVESIDGVDTRVDSDIFTINSKLSPKSGQTARDDILSLMESFVGNADFRELFVELVNRVD